MHKQKKSEIKNLRGKINTLAPVYVNAHYNCAPEKERKNWEKNNKIKKHACKQVRAVCTHMTKKIFEIFFLKINLFEKKI